MGYIEEQIAYVEETVAIKKRLGKDASFEEDLIKEWQKWLPSGPKYYLWVKHSAGLRRKQAMP